MTHILKDLVIDRVDLVDEGANSAAFIELYKRKENEDVMDYEEILSKMKPEHAAVITEALNAKEEELTKARGELDEATQSISAKDAELEAANDALAKANAELDTLKSKNVCKECGGELNKEGNCPNCQETSKSFDEVETLKSMPEAARELFLKMRAQKEAAEEELRKRAEEKLEADAIAKAASLKAIPVEQDKLVGIIKSATPELLDLLTVVNSAIESTVLTEVGKNVGNGAKLTDESAWAKLEKRAAEIAERDSVTKEKAMSKALSENPELYQEYLNGGMN